jgi:ubiquinone/menaquinone biosynthesis C-methylase UbiE
MRLIQTLLRPIYYLLYHQFAWTYDLVAAVVSLGRWQEWISIAVPHLRGRVLEIGFGPGHLQISLVEKNLPTYGLDESPQMNRQAARRLKRIGKIPNLVRGYAQYVPFATEAFNSVVATFPSEYIFDSQSLREIHRLLLPGGNLVIIPTAWITGRRMVERLAAWVFRVTGEAPGKPHDLPVPVKNRINQAGFLVKSEVVETKGSQVLLIVATKT